LLVLFDQLWLESARVADRAALGRHRILAPLRGQIRSAVFAFLAVRVWLRLSLQQRKVSLDRHRSEAKYDY
jgi:hypothetical protein